MILPRYHIAASTIPGAGQGLFIDEPVALGQVVTAPDAIPQVFTLADILASPTLSAQFPASARWFEDRYTLSPDWPDECYVNHSFNPTGLWHLGFVFATAELPAGTELTVDYRHLLPPGQAEDFADAATGKAIIGYSWHDSIANSTRELAALLACRQGIMMFEIPTIRTERLRLTALTERHFDDYAAMLADPESTQWIGDGMPLDRASAWRSLAMLLGHWQLRGCGMWALELAETGAFIGRCGLMYPEGWPDLELGWMLKPEHRHHGYATEAGAAVLDFAWRQLRAQRVISLVGIGNEASDRVAERLGGEHIEDMDFFGADHHVFAYYPPHRMPRRAYG